MKPKGKTTCDITFIAAFIEARDEVRRTGKRTPIKGYGGWFVLPTKELED
jgi:hypothetical protein